MTEKDQLKVRMTTVKPSASNSKRDFYYSLEFSQVPQNLDQIARAKTWADADSLVKFHDIEFVCLSQKKNSGADKYLVKIPTGNTNLPIVEYWALRHFDRIFVVDTNTSMKGGKLRSITGFLDLIKDGDDFKYSDPEVFQFDPLTKIKINEMPNNFDRALQSIIAPFAEKVGVIELYSGRKKKDHERLLIVTDCNLGDLAKWNTGAAQIMELAPPLPPNSYFGYASADKKNAHQLCEFMHMVNSSAQ